MIIRFLTGDHPVHSPQSLTLIKEAIQEKIILQIDSLVIAECVFVLHKVYSFTKHDVVDKLLKLLDFSGIHALDKNIIIEALHVYNRYNIDYVDAYLAAKSRSKDGTTVITYNVKDFKKAEAIYTTPDDPLLYQ
ncbi:MAG: PIN domain-containing protein [Paenibacillaceae bacterium]